MTTNYGQRTPLKGPAEAQQEMSGLRVEAPTYCSFCLEECEPVIVLAMVCCPDCAEADPKERVRRALERWGRR